MADAHKNFASSLVTTAPSPATSGTSLVVTTGDGTKFPTAPFNATVYPAATQPTTGNAEIVRVTAVATDTLTIVRTQESTSARTIGVGDVIVAGITAKTLTDVETSIALGIYRSGYFPVGVTSGNAFTAINGTVYYLPLVISAITSLDRITISVTTAGSTGSVVRLGIYADTGRATPGSLVLDAGTASSATTGTKEITIAQTLTPGLYWVCVVAQGAPTTNPQLRAVVGSAWPMIPMPWGTYTSLPTDSQTPTVTYSAAAGGGATTTTTGALPGTSPTTSVSGAAGGPNIFVRIV